MEDADNIITVFDAGFVNSDDFPFHGGKMVNPNWFDNLELPAVQGITSNVSHCSPKSIARIKKEFDPDIESMEGAAVFYVCLLEKIPFLEIRAISNYVDSRDTEKWDIPKATENLTNEIFRFLWKFSVVTQLSD
jgi:futalosine hydrolase